MKQGTESDLGEAYRRLAQFRSGATGDRLFVHPTPHPAGPTGFCYCEGSLRRAVSFHWKALTLGIVLRLPSSRLKAWWLRRLGAAVEKGVYLSAGVWIDPMFPELLRIEEGVFLGMGTRIFTHEFRVNEFRAGKVIIRRRAFVGGFSLIACGVEIGEGAVVAACSVVDRDVPAGATLVAPPARILKLRQPS